jgi:putative glutamine amidotransferase
LNPEKPMKRVLIGITKPEDRFINIPFIAVWIAIWLGGGKPHILSANKNEPIEEIQGLILGGGTDIYPELYNEKPLENYKYDRTRDAMEIKWLKIAEKTNIPVFAICRGAQLMNVIKEGTLHKDIHQVYKNTNYPKTAFGYLTFRKKILIEEKSLLNQIFKRGSLMVNSIHKQSIDKVGKDLVITAVEENGVVQAIEDPSKDFYLGVQFHPELLLYRKSFRNFFRKFIESVNKNTSM